VRITASSMLEKDDVDRMVQEAEEHAEEDKALREAVEARNQAEGLVGQAERTIEDLGDKVSDEDKATVEKHVEAVRDALKGEDGDVLKNTTKDLTNSLQEVATKAYQASEPSGPDMNGATDDGGDTGEEGEAADADADAEEAVEGEFKEV